MKRGAVLWCKESNVGRGASLRLPLTVQWTDENWRRETLTETRDVSSRGICFILPRRPKSGSPVEILMTFPNQVTQAGPVRIRCRGRIVRIGPERLNEVEVIAAIERFHFLREAEGAA